MRIWVTTAFITFLALGASTMLVAPASAEQRTHGVSSIRPDRLDVKQLLGTGGTFTLPNLSYDGKLQWAATLGYAPNSLGKQKIRTILTTVIQIPPSDGPPPPPPSMTLDWLGIIALQTYVQNITFDPASLFLTISGAHVDPFTSYTIFVYEGECRGYCYGFDLLETVDVGFPVNGQLSMASPMENGFDLTQNTLYFELAHTPAVPVTHPPF